MRKKICFIVTIPEIVHAFLKDHIAALSEDYDIYLVGDIRNPNKIDGLALKGWLDLNIPRKISIIEDVKAFCGLYRYFRKMKFDAVHSAMPKAGLVAALAGKLAKIPNRIHIFTGQVWATKNGFMRSVLKMADQLICLLDNFILVDGKSQRDFLVAENVVKEGKGIVFKEGSICGVNSYRFVPLQKVRDERRARLGISESSIVFIFLGRLNHDKGTYDLLSAFDRIAAEIKDVYLLLAGDDEENCIHHLDGYSNIILDKNLIYYGYVKDPEYYLQAGDVFCLPSYREGFGSSIIEAACLGLPSICSDTYGLRDAMVDNVTGLRCKVGDVNSLYDCMKAYCDDRSLIRKYGEAAKNRALESFSGKDITCCWVSFYKKILA